MKLLLCGDLVPTAATVPATPNAPQLVLEDGGGNVAVEFGV